ncbi:DUF3237 family protein [Pontibaca methylaminivorans]|uniref:DUF3237 family protein n=1 Tax=Pontibaca methylaminivorans TaxID=515897 RepID=UPI002FDAA233
MRGEKISEFSLETTGITDCGVTLEAVLSGQVPVPPQGIRLDLAFEGPAVGRLAGKVRGVDYIRMRADGRVDLDVRSIMETDDGHRIALSASGVAVPGTTGPVADVFENMELITAAPEYQWVNTRQVWAVGTADFSTGRIQLATFMQ